MNRYPAIDIGWATIYLHDQDSIRIVAHRHHDLPAPPFITKSVGGEQILVARAIPSRKQEAIQILPSPVPEAIPEYFAHIPESEFWARKRFADEHAGSVSEWWLHFHGYKAG